MEEAINGRVDYGFILVTRVFFTHAQRQQNLKKKKKNRFKFVKLNLSLQVRV